MLVPVLISGANTRKRGRFCAEEKDEETRRKATFAAITGET